MSDQIDHYIEFARDLNIHCKRPREKFRLGGEGKEKLRSSMAGESKQPGVNNDNKLGGTSNAGFDTNEDEDEDETLDTTNEVDDILCHPEERGSKSMNIRKIIHSLLKLLVKYLTAQETLETYCESLGPVSDHEIDIKLLRVNPREGDMPKWDEIKTVIISVLVKSVDSDDLIKYIEEIVKKFTKDGNIPPHIIFHTFTDIIHGVPQSIPYNIHCEAALVSFASTDGKGIKDQALRTLKMVCTLFI